MLKHLSVFFTALALSLVVACTNMPGVSPAQQAVNTTATACEGTVAAIKAANQAVLAGVLKGNDARNALKGLTAAQEGCNAALGAIQAANTAAAATPAASGAKP